MVYNPNAHLPQQPNLWSREAATAPAVRQTGQPAPAPVYYEQPLPSVAQYALPPAPAYTTPNYPAPYEPTPVAPVAPEKKKKGISTLTKALIGGAVLAIGGAGAIIVVANQKANERVNEIKDTPIADSPAAERNGAYETYPIKLLPDTATGDQFANLDPHYPYQYSIAEQMDFIAPELNKDIEDTIKRIRESVGQSHFTGEDGVTPRAVAAPSRTNTAQQISDQISLGTFKAWEIAQTGDVEKAEKYATGVTDPLYDEYENIIDAFDSKKPSMTEGVAWDEKEIITSGDYMGISASQEGPLIQFNKTSTTNTNDRFVVVARFDQGSTPDANRWRLLLVDRIE